MPLYSDPMPLFTDPIVLGVDFEIERMRMCVEFGRSSLLAEEHPQCLLEAKWVDTVMKAIRHWDTASTECVIFLKMVFLLPEPSVVLFIGPPPTIPPTVGPSLRRRTLLARLAAG